MKKLLTGFLVGVLMLPVGVQAQTVDQSSLDSQMGDLKSQLIALLTAQLDVLIARLEALENKESRVSVSDSNAVGGGEVEEFDVDIDVEVTDEKDEDGRIRVLFSTEDSYERGYLDVWDSKGNQWTDTGTLDVDMSYDPGTYTWKAIAHSGNEKVEKTGSFTVK